MKSKKKFTKKLLILLVLVCINFIKPALPAANTSLDADFAAVPSVCSDSPQSPMQD